MTRPRARAASGGRFRREPPRGALHGARGTNAGAASLSTPYAAAFLEHFEHPRNLGDLSPCDAAATVRDSRGRDELRLTFRLEGARVAEVRFRARGCPVAIAAGSAATCLLTGRTIREALRLSDDEVIAALGGLPSSRQRRSVLAARAIRSALGKLDR